MMKHRRTEQCLNGNDKNLSDRDLRLKEWPVGLCVGASNGTLIAFQVKLSKDNKVRDLK